MTSSPLLPSGPWWTTTIVLWLSGRMAAATSNVRRWPAWRSFSSNRRPLTSTSTDCSPGRPLVRLSLLSERGRFLKTWWWGWPRRRTSWATSGSQTRLWPAVVVTRSVSSAGRARAKLVGLVQASIRQAAAGRQDLGRRRRVQLGRAQRHEGRAATHAVAVGSTGGQDRAIREQGGSVPNARGTQAAGAA